MATRRDIRLHSYWNVSRSDANRTSTTLLKEEGFMLHFLFPSVWEVATAAATLDQRWAPPLQMEELRPELASLGDFREQHSLPALDCQPTWPPKREKEASVLSHCIFWSPCRTVKPVPTYPVGTSLA